MASIRDATPADYDAFARLFAELQVDDPIASRERFAAELCARTIVAVTDGGAVAGYALFEVLADAGYTRNIASDPAHRRTGVGIALMAALRARFVAAGATTWCLNVKPDNAVAIALYERAGLRAAYRTAAIRIPRDVVLPVPAPDLIVEPAPAEDDARAEPALRLLRGQLASARTRPSREVLRMRRGDELLGIATFNPSIPGAFPFRVRAPELGPQFAALLRPRVPADAAYLQLGVEDDEPLRDALLATGAHVHLEILHMRGPL